jgi:peptidyl-tRNA hydrolase
MEIKYKQFVIVPKKPKMSPGKIASQVAHSTYLALERDIEARAKGRTRMWQYNGMCVIVLQCKDTQQLLAMAQYLTQWNVAHHLYIDEGLTEVDPFTPTCLATGVIKEDQFWIFEGLELYE